MRTIDADALAAHMFHGYGTEITPVDIDAETYKLGWNDAIEAIMDNAPTIEPAQRTGEWILKEHLWECDQCGCRINREYPLSGNIWNYYYCPNCGADCRGGQDE